MYFPLNVIMHLKDMKCNRLYLITDLYELYLGQYSNINHHINRCPCLSDYFGHLSVFASIHLSMQLTVLSMSMGSTSARLAPIFILSLWIPSRSSFTRFIGRHLQQQHGKHETLFTLIFWQLCFAEKIDFYNKNIQNQTH